MQKLERTFWTIAFALSFSSASAQVPFIPKDQFGEAASDAWPWVPNEGQVFDIGGTFRDDVLFHSVGTFPSLYAMKHNRVAVVVPDDDLPTHAHDSLTRVDFAFTGLGAKDPTPILWDETPRRYNFYEQFTPQGVVGVTGGKRVIYEDIYEGIDLHLYSNKWGPKMYIVVHPDGDPNQIRITWSGQDSLKIDLDGYLKVWFKHKFMKLTQGLAYQQNGNNIVAVPWIANYSVSNDQLNTSFTFGTYNHTLPLILMVRPFNPSSMPLGGGQPEPPEWCTYMAGTQDDVVNDLAHDENGFLYFIGHSKSGASTLPITTGAFQPTAGGGSDVIVGRFNEFYEVETPETWMTYFGGPQDDFGSSIAYDAQNERVLVGGSMSSNTTEFPNFPLASNASSYSREGAPLSGFVAFFEEAAGVATYFSRVPGTCNVYDDVDVAVDGNGNSFVVGHGFLLDISSEQAASPIGSYVQYQNVQTGLLLYNGYVLELDDEANLTWFTPIGGPEDEFVYGCAVDPIGQWLYVVGGTGTRNDPNQNFSCSAAASQYEFPLCEFQSGYFQDNLNGQGADPYPALADGFIMRFRITTHTLDWSTYVGGGLDDAITDVAVDSEGLVYVTGYSSTPFYNSTACDWNSADDGMPKCDAGGFFNLSPTSRRQFIARFQDDTKLDWGTKIGDNNAISGTWGSSHAKLTIDEADNVYLYGTTYYTGTTYVPPLPPLSYSGVYFNSDHADAAAGGKTDTYIAHFSPATHQIHTSFFGGVSNDNARGLTATEQRLYICGSTYSYLNFPTNAPTIAGHAPYLNETPMSVLAQSKADGFIAQLRYDVTIGMEEPTSFNASQLAIYPNPTQESIEVQLTGTLGVEATVEILNTLGQVVSVVRANGRSQINIPIGHLADGTYCAVVRNNGPRVSARFVVRH